MNRYVFMIKSCAITPIDLDLKESPEVIVSLLKQDFYLSNIRIKSTSSQQALMDFDSASQLYGCDHKKIKVISNFE